MASPTPEPVGGRRSFLRLTGAGIAAAGVAAAAPGRPAGAAGVPAFAFNVKDDFSAVGDGITDDAPAFQAAFTELGRPPGSGGSTGVTGGYLLIPPGDYLLRSTVQLHRFAGVVQGAGAGNGPMPMGELATGQGTVLRWGGPAGEPMVRITDSTLLTVNDIRFFGDDDAVPLAGLEFVKDSVHHSQGTNGHLMVNDCYFGTWPWTGPNRGLIASGIKLTGTVGDNDQFRVSRCVFSGRRGKETSGFRAEWPQSVWGSLHDCTFTSVDTGFDSPASTTLINPQFNSCGTDLVLRSTAHVDILGWQSENSERLAALQPWSSLSSIGGVCQLNDETLRPGTPMIDAFPSSSGQTISLRDMRFIVRRPNAYQTGPLPDIRFGAPEGHASAGGFFVRVDGCLGLEPSQCTLVTPMPEASRGTVEWHSRAGRIHQFRNELRGTGEGGTRATLDTGVWDPPLPGST